MTYAIGIDVGGSLIKIGLVDDTGNLTAKKELPTPTSGSAEQILNHISEQVQQLTYARQIDLKQVVGIGIGMPGHINPDRKSSASSNVPRLDHFPLVDFFHTRFNLPTYLDNDATLAAMAEYQFGQHPKTERLLLMTIGSGIGAGLIIHGEPYRMTRGCSGDPGHIIVDPTLKWRCRIGCRGCLETVASGQALIRNAAARAEWDPQSPLGELFHKNPTVSAYDVIALARMGDPHCLELLDEISHWLALGLVSWCYFFDPQVILIGGGLSEAGDLLLSSIRSKMLEIGIPTYVQNVNLSLARFRNEAGVLGAASLVFMNPSTSGSEKDGE